MTSAGLLFCITFFYVFAKAFQQRNVVFNNMWAIPLFSYAMGYAELAGLSVGVVEIINNGWSQLLVLGFAHGSGGTLGCWAAIYLHKRIFKNGRKP